MYMFFFFFQAEDGIRDIGVTGVQTCALPIYLRNNRTVTIDAYFSQALTGAAADGSPTIPVANFVGTSQVGSGTSSNVSWSGVGAVAATVLLSGQTGTGGTDLPRQLDASSTTYDVTFGLSLSVPAAAYPSTYTTTLTFRVTTS